MLPPNLRMKQKLNDTMIQITKFFFGGWGLAVRSLSLLSPLRVCSFFFRSSPADVSDPGDPRL